MAYRGSGIGPLFGGFGPLFGLRRDIDRLFEDAFAGRGTSVSWTPAVNIREDQENLNLELELPGIKPEDVDISVENGVLTVSGEKSEQRKEDEEGRYHLVERTYGRFSRSFQLPQGVNEEQISADFNHGLLTVQIPKAALPQPRRIQIGTGSQQQVGGGTQGQRQVGGGTTQAREQTSGREQTGGRGGKTGGRTGGGGGAQGGEREQDRMAARQTGEMTKQ